MDIAREKIVKPALFDLIPQPPPVLESGANGNDFSKLLRSPPPPPPAPPVSHDEPRRTDSRSNENYSRAEHPATSSNHASPAKSEAKQRSEESHATDAADPKSNSAKTDDQVKSTADKKEVKEDKKEASKDEDKTDKTVVSDPTVIAQASVVAQQDVKKSEPAVAETATKTEEKVEGAGKEVQAKPVLGDKAAQAVAGQIVDGAGEGSGKAVEIIATTEVSTAAKSETVENAPEKLVNQAGASHVEGKQKKKLPEATKEEKVEAAVSPEDKAVAPVLKEAAKDQTASAQEVSLPLEAAPTAEKPSENKTEKTKGESAMDAAKPAAAHETPVAIDPVAPVVPTVDVPSKPLDKTPAVPESRDPANSTNPIGNAPRANAAALKSGSRAAGTETSNSPTIDPARFLQRVARAFQVASQRDGEVRLRLHPPELGAIKVEIQVQDGTLTARVQTETADARTAILDNLPALRERLAEQGIKIEKFDVDLFDQSGGQPQQSRDQSQDKAAKDLYPRSNVKTNSTIRIDAPESPAGPTRVIDNQRINIIV